MAELAAEAVTPSIETAVADVTTVAPDTLLVLSAPITETEQDGSGDAPKYPVVSVTEQAPLEMLPIDATMPSGLNGIVEEARQFSSATPVFAIEGRPK